MSNELKSKAAALLVELKFTLREMQKGGPQTGIPANTIEDLIAILSLPSSRDDAARVPVVSVQEMKTSAGPDYFVSIKCDDRELTPYNFKIKGRAEFSAAEFQWLLNGGDKPDLSDWLDRTDEPAPLPSRDDILEEAVIPAIAELFEFGPMVQARVAIAIRALKSTPPAGVKQI